MNDKDVLRTMTLEVLWELFPINLVPYNSLWSEWAKREIKSLATLLSSFDPVINHIGSTAIPGIFSKPIVDILVETSDSIRWENIIDIMELNDYILMSRREGRMSFNKGYTINGYAENVFHIHFHIAGDRDEIIFRDFLIGNNSVAKEYERLKLSLLPRFRNDRDGYTMAKTEFVNKVLLRAKK